MRISDWSSDVCSSDLVLGVILPHYIARGSRESAFRMKLGADHRLCDLDQVRMVREEQHLCGPSDLSEDTEACLSAPVVEVHEEVVGEERSEERREGKECVSTCRSRGARDH